MSAPPSLFNPYPGLRPFRASETYLFFGRSAQVDELLAELRESRFIAVMGASGSGKSSLVAAGLLPALHGGFSPRMGSRWLIASFRPGGNPIHNLARALAAPDVLGSEDTDPSVAVPRMEAMLRGSGLGLADTARQNERLADGRLLVIVDQFEELFRFQAAAADGGMERDGATFVQLLIEATRDEDSPVDVIVTMRSDFLGDCAQFQELPEAINDGLYLVPRLTRTQLREAITGPAAVGGAEMMPRLIQRLLNDAGSDPDVLPVVQHALMRTWDLWAEQGEPGLQIDLEHYEAGGGLEEALARHADEAYFELADDRSRRIAELMFKRLTELGEDGREGRHPTRLDEIAAVTEASPGEVREVIGHFEGEGRSFVTVSADDVVDISHESLIRQWPRLRTWVSDEAASRDVYRRLADRALSWKRGEAALLRDPDLQIDVRFWSDRRPNRAWAERYNPAFTEAAEYLERSRRAAKRRQLRSVGAVVALGVLAGVVAVLIVWAVRAQADAQRQQRIAVGGPLAAVSVQQGSALKVQSTLTAIEALRSTAPDALRLPAAEEALRTALEDPLGSRLPGRVGQLGHVEDIESLAFSSDGRWLATGSRDNAVMLWNRADLAADPVPLIRHEDDVVAVAFSPDGRWLATGSHDNTAMLWNLEDLDADPKILQHEDDVLVVAFSPDGRWLATGSQDTDVLLHDLANPDDDARRLTLHEGFVLALAFSPDGRWLATGGGDERAFLWDLEDLDADPEVLAHGGDVVTLAFGPNGESLATGSDKTVRIWDPNNASADPEPLDHGGAVTTLAFSLDGRWLATGSEDNVARLWDRAGSADAPSVLVHAGHVDFVSFSADSRFLATGGPFDPARLFRIDAATASPTELAGPVTALGFSPDGRWLAIGSDEGSARLWSVGALETRPSVLNHDDAVNAVAFSPDSRRLATGTAANTTYQWTVDAVNTAPDVRRIDEVEGFELAGVETLAYSPDGTRLATGGGDHYIRMWDVASRDTERETRALNAGVNDLAFDPLGRWLAVAVQDEVTLLFDADDLAAEPSPLEGHGDEVTTLAFSSDGKWLATGSRDGTVLLRDGEDIDADPIPLLVHDEPVTSLAFGADGRRLAVGSRDRTVSIWDLDGRSPAVVHVLNIGGPVFGVAYRPDGKLLAIATGDVQLWDLSTPDPEDPLANAVVLLNHAQSVNAVAFSPDGRWLATGSEDGTARMWLPLDELVKLGCESAGRNLTHAEWVDIKPGEPYAKTCEQWPEGP